MKTIFSALILILFCLCSYAQDDLLSMLEETEEPEKDLTSATFKGSRLINGHSVMTRKKGSLEFLIAHRFGLINSGGYELFGLDNANVRFGLEYGFLDQLTIGVGRNSFEKTYDSFAKIALIRQQTGKRVIPFSVTLFGSAALKTLQIDPEEKLDYLNELSYTGQVLIASKINEFISLQVMPTYIHYNQIEDTRENDLMAVGVGGRIKLTKRISINGEYYYRLTERDLEGNFDSIAFGIDLETGGHVFQLQFTNSRAMIEKGFIRETTGDYFAGDIHFGFNITRTF